MLLKRKVSLDEITRQNAPIIHKHHPHGRKNDPTTVEFITDEEHRKEHGNIPNAKNPELFTTYESYKLWQREEGRMERMIGSYRGTIRNTTPSPYIQPETFELFEHQLEIYKMQKNRALTDITHLVHQTPEWIGFMKDAPGMGEITAALLISKVKIEKADTVSSLWSYLGYIPDKNNPSKREENPGKCKAFKSPLYAALSISLIRKDSPYRNDYDNFKAKLEKQIKANGKPKGHYEAINRTTKLWLSHLWATGENGQSCQ